MLRAVIGVLSSAPPAYPWSLDFEAGVTGWVGDTGTTITQSNSTAHGGTYSGRFINSAGAYKGGGIALPAPIEIKAGVTVVVTCWIYGNSGISNLGVNLVDDSHRGYGTIATLDNATQFVAEYASQTTYVGYLTVTGTMTVLNWYRHVLTVTDTTITAAYYNAAGTLICTKSQALVNLRTVTQLFIRTDQNTYTYVDDISITVTGA